MQVQVIDKPLPYNKRRYQVGDPVEMPPKHAQLFIAIGRVQAVRKSSRADIPAAPLVEMAPVSDEVPQSETAVAERPRRQYRRRDMRPDNRDPQAED